MWTDLRRPTVSAVLAVCAVVMVLHQWAHRDFLIDDAAICFTFARNIAAGEGVVPWPGGERIEAFSDPTWVAILTLFQLVGLTGFQVAKPLAALFGLGTTWLVYRSARLALPEDRASHALFAPAALALSAQFALWSASGLENGLFCLLLALGIERTVVESRAGRFAGSSLAFLALTWTRPEGIAYAACGGFWFLLAAARAHGWRGAVRPVLGWLALFWLPTLALEALRVWYFGWALPQTWYAKIVTRSTFPLAWNQRGWNQAREFAGRLWQVYLLPVYALGVLGRRRLTWGVIGFVALTLVYPAPEIVAELPFYPKNLPEPPQVWLQARVVLYAALIVGLPFLRLAVPSRESLTGSGFRFAESLGESSSPGADVASLCWHSAGIGLLFSVFANGDWMGGYRWMSLFVPPVTVLFALGASELVSAVDRWLPDPQRPGAGTAASLLSAFAVAAWLPPNLNQSRDHLTYNGDETAFRLILRADYTDSVRKRTFFEGVVQNLEMDQGGTTWRRPDYVQIDMAGLVDIPMAHHNYGQRAFVEEYVFTEHEPTFAHVHGWWAQYCGFKTYPQWENYFPLPPHRDLPPAPPLHPGMWANRSLLFAPEWPHAAQRVAFDGELVVHGAHVPASVWPVDGDGYFELGLQTPPRDALRVIAFLARDGAVAASWELPLGYGMLDLPEWRADDVYVGRYAVVVPASVAPGRYDLGFVVLDSGGGVLRPGGVAGDLPVDPGVGIGGTEALPAVYAAGELRFAGAVEVAPRTAVDAATAEVAAEALAAAAAGQCAEAEAKWIVAKRYHPRAWDENEARAPRSELAACWARDAERAADPLPSLANAHRWDHHHPELARVGGPIGDRLWDEGMAARAAGDPETAYRRFADLLTFQPWRSWARRYAEEARDQRLGLHETDVYDPKIDPKVVMEDEAELPGGPPNPNAPDAPPAPMIEEDRE